MHRTSLRRPPICLKLKQTTCHWHGACCAKLHAAFRFGEAISGGEAMARTTLTLSSKNYSSWSLRGWLMTKLAGIDFDEVTIAPDDADARAEILLLSPSILVPCLTYEGIKIWDTLAIGEFLNEIAPKAGLLPKDRAKRAH